MTHRTVWHECLRYAVYHAPRGKPRLLELGHIIQQRYLAPQDQLVGVIGEAGTGKSSLIRGMFPGLELTNEDDSVNVRPVPLLKMFHEGEFRAHTYHIDVAFETAFSQPFELAEAVRAALDAGRRVVIEHFDLIWPHLKINAEFLMGIGEEIIVSRPDLFGPTPEEMRRLIEGTAIQRRMVHSAEDITSMVLERDWDFKHPLMHRDVKRGFVIEFDEKPEGLDIARLEQTVRDIIAAGTPVNYRDENHIQIGEYAYHCTGPRIHVKNSTEIRNFRLQPELYYDPISRTHCLVGLAGDPETEGLSERSRTLLF